MGMFKKNRFHGLIAFTQGLHGKYDIWALEHWQLGHELAP